MKRNILTTIFKFLSDTINGGENAIIDAVSAFTPYLVPVIPAYLTLFHVKDIMHFPVEIAWTAAIVVEFLGLSSMATTIRFWRNNQRYKKDSNKAPFYLALGTYIFYIIIVLSVNVILELVDGSRNGWVIFSIGLFSLLSVPSGVLISIRGIYRDMLDEREEQRHGNQSAQSGNQPTQYKQKPASHYYDKIREMVAEEHGKSGRLLTPKEVTMKLNLDHDRSKGYVSTTITNWAAENGVDKNAPPKNPLSF